jgi:hypothetical protein
VTFCITTTIKLSPSRSGGDDGPGEGDNAFQCLDRSCVFQPM